MRDLLPSLAREGPEVGRLVESARFDPTHPPPAQHQVNRPPDGLGQPVGLTDLMLCVRGGE